MLALIALQNAGGGAVSLDKLEFAIFRYPTFEEVELEMCSNAPRPVCGNALVSFASLPVRVIAAPAAIVILQDRLQ
jgi:hypothetical protein